MTSPPLSAEAAQAQAAADTAVLLAALKATSGAVSTAARALGVSVRTLHRRIDACGLRAWLTETYPRSARQPKR